MKKMQYALALFLLASAAWLGVGYQFGARAEKVLVDASMTSCIESKSGWRVSGLEHNRGFLSSAGKLMLSSCAANAAVPVISATATYSIDHLPTSSGSVKFVFDLAPIGKAKINFKEIFGPTATLHGSGQLGWSGVAHVKWSLPPVALRKSGEAVDVTATNGTVDIDGDKMYFAASIDRAIVRGKKEAVDFRGLSINLSSTNPSLGTGNATVRLDSLETNGGGLQGLEIAVQSVEHGDRIDSNVSYAIAKVNALGEEYLDTKVAIALDGLYAKSVEGLLKLFKESNGFSQITPSEKRMVAQNLEQLVANGFSFNAPTIQGRNSKGSVTGNVALKVAPASAGERSLSSRVTATASVEFAGDIVPAKVVGDMLKSGMALRKADAITSRYEYAKGVLRINDSTRDAVAIEQGLDKLDRGFQTLLADLRR